MTFSKAANLLRVADMATSRYDGIRLQDVTDEFGCDHRTAQRMMRAFCHGHVIRETREWFFVCFQRPLGKVNFGMVRLFMRW